MVIFFTISKMCVRVDRSGQQLAHLKMRASVAMYLPGRNISNISEAQTSFRRKSFAVRKCSTISSANHATWTQDYLSLSMRWAPEQYFRLAPARRRTTPCGHTTSSHTRTTCQRYTFVLERNECPRTVFPHHTNVYFRF